MKNNPQIPDGLEHQLPEDFKDALVSSATSLQTWRDLTPLARTEWIAWINDAKRLETRNKRIDLGIEKLSQGSRRPCCWPGYKNVNKYKKPRKP